MSEVNISDIKSSSFIRVANLELAVCLLSVGVPLYKHKSHNHVRLKDGKEKWLFNFQECSEDGSMNTQELIKAFSEDMKWIHQNPEHPFTFAMCAVKNMDWLKANMVRSVPIVSYKSPSGSAVLFIKEGGKKEKNCIKKGMVRCNPDGS